MAKRRSSREVGRVGARRDAIVFVVDVEYADEEELAGVRLSNVGVVDGVERSLMRVERRGVAEDIAS